MALPTNMIAFTSLFTQLVQRRIAQLVMGILLVYIAYVFASITWSVVPQAQSSHNTTVNATSKNGNSNKTRKMIDVAKIQSLNLFGQYNDTAVEEIEVEMSNVPETK